jgi:GNAT superfamily N-acetyltransferase
MQYPRQETPQIVEIHGLERMVEQHELIHSLNPAVDLARYRTLLSQMLPQGYRMVGAFVQGRCIGLSGFWIGTKLYSGKYLEIDNFVIDQTQRSAGIGKLLTQWLEQEARRRQCETVMLDAYTVNTEAHRFYFREGYVIKGFHFLKDVRQNG